MKVLIIGASRGIGLSLVHAFAAHSDVEVIGTVRKPSDGDYNLANASSITLDISSLDSITAAAESVPELDILLVNAGMGIAEPVLDLTPQEFQRYLDINLVGPWEVVKAFLPALRAGREKKIVFTSSISGSMQANYEEKASVRGAYAITKVCI
jgi:NAD(P)-dependent dehydrogenase (short-subunit alcohol dehydrogenase family)